jgi:hypothetical protein
VGSTAGSILTRYSIEPGVILHNAAVAFIPICIHWGEHNSYQVLPRNAYCNASAHCHLLEKGSGVRVRPETHRATAKLVRKHGSHESKDVQRASILDHPHSVKRTKRLAPLVLCLSSDVLLRRAPEPQRGH